MNRFKTRPYANYAAVKSAAETLMIINGETTTLEVKKLLRLEGFLAFQQEISRMMDDLSQEKDWSYSCNGLYRTYTFRINMDYQIDAKVPPFGYN